MEPNDPQLRDLLQEWKAPPVPAALEQRVLSRRGTGWRFLVSGYIRVPIPLACGVAVLMLGSGWWLARETAPTAPCVTAAARICTSIGICRG
jgi:hypothetical protein